MTDYFSSGVGIAVQTALDASQWAAQVAQSSSHAQAQASEPPRPQELLLAVVLSAVLVLGVTLIGQTIESIRKHKNND